MLHNWNWMRAIRLVIGVALLVQGFFYHELPAIAIGGILSTMAFMNIGCMGGACSVPVKKVKQPLKETEYEEVA
jgi:hypothetical protein